MANPLDIVIRLFSRGADDVRDDFRDVGDAADDLDGSLEDSANSLAKMEAMEGLASAGEKLTQLGAGATQMADGWAQAAEEGLGLQTRMESILKTQGKLNDLPKIDRVIQDITVRGHFDDDDPIRQAAIHLQNAKVQADDLGNLLEGVARTSRSSGKSLDAVAMAMGRAYNTGKVASLAKFNLFFTKQEQETLKAAYALNKHAGQAKFTEMVTATLARTTGGLADSLTETQRKANDSARAWDDLQTALGTGSSKAKSNIQAIIGQMVELAANNPALLEQAGAWTYYGGTAATAAGSVLSVGANLGMAVMGAKTLGISGPASMAALKAGAASTMITVAALAATIYGVIKAYEGLRDAQMGDEKLKKKHGAWGDIWAEGGKWLGNSKAASYTPVGWAAGNKFWDGPKNNDDWSGEVGPVKKRETKTPSGDTTIRFETTLKRNKAAKAFG